MKHPILWIKSRFRYRTRKIRWYLRRDVLAHRWYLGTWPITTEIRNGVYLEYNYPIGVMTHDELSFVPPAAAKALNDLQMHD